MTTPKQLILVALDGVPLVEPGDDLTPLLASAVENLARNAGANQLHHEPSFTTGKHLFQVANCIACMNVLG